MKVVLYAAISLDGFIAKANGDSEWVSDTGEFEKTIQEAGAYIVGSKTYNQFLGDIYPIKNATTLVLTKNMNHADSSIVCVHTPEEAINFLEQKNKSEVIVVGGSKTWSAFLSAGLCDEIIFDVEPILLGSGMKFIDSYAELLHIGSKPLANGVMQNKYQLRKIKIK